MNTPDAFVPLETINKARDLLNSQGKKLTGEALEEIERSINLLCAKFNDLDDHLALQVCGLIGLAIAKGSKNAAKKKPKLSRWNSDEPPSLTELTGTAERYGAIKLLKSIKGAWIANYAYINAAQCSGDKQTTSALLKWIETGTTSSIDILLGLTEFLTILPTSTEKQVETILKQAPTAFDLQHTGDTNAFSCAFFETVNAAINALKSNAPYFGKVNPVEIMVSVCEKASGLNPQILFSPEIQNALGYALDAIAKPSKATSLALSKIGNRLLSLGAWHVKLHGNDGSTSILETLCSIDSNLSLSTIAKKSADYSHLLIKSESKKTKTVSTADIHTLASSLLLAWENISRDPSLVKIGGEVTSLIHSISLTLGLIRFGVAGQTISYDPFRHFIDSEPTNNVVIVIPGIAVTRIDGSERVLVKAVVKSA